MTLPLLFLLSSVSSSIDADSVPLTVEVLWRTTFIEGVAAGLVEPTGAAEIGSRLWIADAPTGRILSIRSDGTLDALVAHRGDGPGEVRAPYLMAATPSGGVAVFDIERNSFEEFDARGAFKARRYLDTRLLFPKGMVALNDTVFALTGGVIDECCGLHFFRASGERMEQVIETGRVKDPLSRAYVGGGAVSLMNNGALLYSAASHHSVYVVEGNSPREVASIPSSYPPTGDRFSTTGPDGVTRMDWKFPRSTGVYGIAGGRILNIVTFRAKHRTLWEVFEATGQLTARIEVEEAFTPLLMTTSGEIIGWIADPVTDEPSIARLRVTLGAD